ncbi:MAG: ABC transporter ATP-binding protein [Candidatus Aminicenantes bacterium RBG_13_63_10]|nr:MAG: ABC transporter ATP-binding protein [Candidatus Aminicenantes bacterium RBG_13_63_10]
MIRITGLRKSFGGKPVLRGLDLEVRRGETMVVIGQSGSGKSVLIRHLIGLMKPDQGTVEVNGTDITRLRGHALQAVTRKIGMLFQGAALFDSMNVFQNVSFGLERQTDLGPEAIRDRVRESLRLVGLKDVENLMPHELSGGMKKRVGLARAIAYRPEILLYDEPSTGIDPIRADAINGLINDLKAELKVTSVVITHDMASCYRVADRIAMLYEGRIIRVGTPDEIQKSPDAVIQQFIRGEAEGPITEW